MIDVPALAAFLRQRRLDLGLTQGEVADHAPGFSTSLLCGYETGRHKPSATRLVAWADALGCDVTFTIRPAPPIQGHFDSLEELREDLRDNAWARRVAVPATSDDLDELRRCLDEGLAAGAARTRVEIDPNVRCRGNQTCTGLEDCHGPIAIGNEVTVYESEAGIEGWGRITDIDYDKRLVWLRVNWAGLREMEEPE